ncbi:gem-associated protein 2 [Pieris brassicae]|uniref:gem-associated protein 2 n=1 Tax=Pieris brassicae TaxID=7116 RepID=UPI001E65E8CD|nr:gem-associated protein 2 [Pieris brassicae]
MTEKCVMDVKRNEALEKDTLLFPCFQISNDVKLKDVPSTGEEYLLAVINERRNCQMVTKCKIDCSKFAQNQSEFVKEIPHPKAPDHLKPTIEWQNIQVADFSDIRLYISRLLDKRSHWPKIRKLKVNPVNEVWINFFESHEPTLSCILGINYKILDIGLEFLIESLNAIKPGSTIPYNTGQWIYAILACTRQPLLPNTVSILRNLARRCAAVRSHINPEEENSKELVTPFNVFICLVSRYFGQFDLAD